MQALLAAALAEAEPLITERGWVQPSGATLAEATRLLSLVAAYPEPLVQIEPDGSLAFEWDTADHRWLSLAVNGQAQLTHSAVINQDEFTQTENFDDRLPDWAAELLTRLFPDTPA